MRGALTTTVIPAAVLLALGGCPDNTTGGATSASDTSGASVTTDSNSEASSTAATSTTSTVDSSTSGVLDTSGASSTDSPSSTDDTSSDTAAVPFTLTSPAFTDGGGIPGVHHAGDDNISPQLDWVGAPDGTMSFGVFFHDTTIDFEHSAIWNIPATASGLPEDVDHVAMPPDVRGAVQCRSWLDEYGYGGPGSPSNFYQFTLFALDVETLPEVDSESALVDVRQALEAHSIGTATLTGQSTGPG